MTQRERTRLMRELVDIKDRLHKHAVQVAYERWARSISEHVADIKRRNEIERMLTADASQAKR